MSFGAGKANNDVLQVPANSVGIAIAIYQRSNVTLDGPGRQYEAGGYIVGGVAVDGGGGLVVNGVYHPVDPWGPLVVSLVQASLVSLGASA